MSPVCFKTWCLTALGSNTLSTNPDDLCKRVGHQSTGKCFWKDMTAFFFFFLTLCTSTQSLNESRVQKINPNKKYPDLEKWTIDFGVKFCYGK